jgi:hypothetical protein
MAKPAGSGISGVKMSPAADWQRNLPAGFTLFNFSSKGLSN